MSRFKAWYEAEGELELPLHVDASDLTVVELAELLDWVEPQLTDWEIWEDNNDE